MVDIVTWRARIGLFCVGPSGRRAKVLRPFPQWSLLSSMTTSSLVHLMLVNCEVVAVVCILLLMLSGDVEINPGPGTGKSSIRHELRAFFLCC